jgi:hypothetical protein
MFATKGIESLRDSQPADLNQLNGYAAEQGIKALCAAAKCKAQPIPSTRKMVEVLQQTTFGKARLGTCQKWLMREFSQNGSFSYEDVPASEFLDRVLGIDLLVNYMGYTIGIDVTVNGSESKLESKHATHKFLRRAYQALKIDKVITLQIEKEPITAEELREAIRAAIQSEGLVLS